MDGGGAELSRSCTTTAPFVLVVLFLPDDAFPDSLSPSSAIPSLSLSNPLTRFADPTSGSRDISRVSSRRKRVSKGLIEDLDFASGVKGWGSDDEFLSEEGGGIPVENDRGRGAGVDERRIEIAASW